jgi:hypothetical protein
MVDDGLSFVIGDLHQLGEELDARLLGSPGRLS